MALKQASRDVLAVIKAQIRTDGRPPTLRELAQAMGWASTNAVRHHLAILEDAGLIARDENLTARGIRVLNGGAK